MFEKYPDRVAAVEWARSVGGGRRLVGGDWIFTDQQLDRLHSDYDALAARLADMTADRDMARRSLEELQQRWTENRPAAEYKARLAEALRVLDTIDDEGDDHYYGIADRARLVLRGIVTMSEQNCMSVNCIAEYGWVIEGGWTDIDKPEYWVGSSAWSGDHMRALRFARRQDAQQAADLMLAGVNVRICEHEWAPARYVLICGVDCHPGDANCNNYCNRAPQKGPMAAYPPKGPDA